MATNISVRHVRHCHPSDERQVSDGSKSLFPHKQCIFIGKRSISIRVLCKTPLFRKKGAGAGVSRKAFSPSFCHKPEPVRSFSGIHGEGCGRVKGV
ncbi:hypothetical protein [uncultured Bacteroides sp.]|uniref:hypothetical protein n=1 Tax=uncultured Bacteroides sp. TaxID=162156 RepID=UPI002621743A|nr:hypothetical protein [uncultured Bacteroides sp.]